MSILVQDAAESIVSADIEVEEPVGFIDRLGQWAQGCGGVEGAASRRSAPPFRAGSLGVVAPEQVAVLYLPCRVGPGRS